MAPAVTAPLAGETSGLRSIQSCPFYKNASGNPLEIRQSRGSIFRGVTMPKYFLQSAWAGKLGSCREELVAVKMILRCQNNPRKKEDLSASPEMSDFPSVILTSGEQWRIPHKASLFFIEEEEYDEPPQCKAGQDIVLQSPVDWVLLDGRESSDDRGIVQYEWTLLQGDSSVEMKVPQPGTLKLSHVQEGGYIFQLTVTDTAGQQCSDNISVTVLPMVHSAVACVGVCSRYQFICDDGCCIDITFACDGVRQCPDGSDETFCQNFSPGRKTVTHAALGTTQQRTVALTENTDENFSAENTLKATARNQPLLSVDADMSNQSLSQGPKKQISGFVPGNSSSGKRTDGKNGNGIIAPKRDQLGGGRPVPETGAVLPLALGLAITALLLLMVACRLRLVRQKLKKARPITSEESDYLINGMYL
ncbi:PREDICTED: low-density lipoprotein receptor-related protein 11 [Fulmarus glacialis]|nr:PREDICTED: low-density lipoprotein receptor-related protein 11 [Fulmarus glacialis]